MGPNVKFVSAITDATKKMGVNFFLKKDQTRGGRGGAEGGLVRDYTFPPFF